MSFYFGKYADLLGFCCCPPSQRSWGRGVLEFFLLCSHIPVSYQTHYDPFIVVCRLTEEVLTTCGGNLSGATMLWRPYVQNQSYWFHRREYKNGFLTILCVCLKHFIWCFRTRTWIGLDSQKSESSPSHVLVRWRLGSEFGSEIRSYNLCANKSWFCLSSAHT